MLSSPTGYFDNPLAQRDPYVDLDGLPSLVRRYNDPNSRTYGKARKNVNRTGRAMRRWIKQQPFVGDDVREFVDKFARAADEGEKKPWERRRRADRRE